jgi:hypothetical protein
MPLFPVHAVNPFAWEFGYIVSLSVHNACSSIFPFRTYWSLSLLSSDIGLKKKIKPASTGRFHY